MPGPAPLDSPRTPPAGLSTALAELAPQAIWMTDLRGTVRYVNEYWCRFTGRTAEDTAAHGWADSLRPETRERTFASFLRSAENGTDYEVEFELRRRDGLYRWFLARAVPLREENGAVVGWTGLALEIHERRAALTHARQQAGDLRDALHSAERANAAKDEFLAKLSHELRTPLNPALMTVQLLAENPSLDEEARTDLALLERNLKTETRLIDDLLDLTRIIHGKLPLRRSRCDLHSLARDAVRICGAGISGKRLIVLDTLGSEPAWVDGDATRLQQVIWNLLANAVKFTPENGTITLSSTLIAGGMIRLAVRDSGLGIDPARIPSLFEAFEQGDGMITRRFGGLGLGLSICQGIVELHGGRIGAGSEGLGAGAVFYFDLPLA